MKQSALLVSLLLCALSLGCASPPLTASFVDNQLLGNGRHVDRAWFRREALHSNTCVRIGDVKGLKVVDAENVPVSQAEAWLRESLETAFGSLSCAASAAVHETRLDAAITELNPGSTGARFAAGELGAGHAWVQVEVALSEPSGGKPIAALVERSRASGVATLQNSRGYDSGPLLIQSLMTEIAKDVRLEIAAELAAASR